MPKTSSADPRAFARRLESLLASQGKTHADIIDAMVRLQGVAIETAKRRTWRWVSGETYPSNDGMRLIARVLGIPLSDLVRAEAPKPDDGRQSLAAELSSLIANMPHQSLTEIAPIIRRLAGNK